VQTHNPDFRHVRRDLRLRNRFDDLGEQFCRRLCHGHQAGYKNSQLARTGEFGTKPTIDKIGDAGLFVEKVKLVLDRLETL